MLRPYDNPGGIAHLIMLRLRAHGARYLCLFY